MGSNPVLDDGGKMGSKFAGPFGLTFNGAFPLTSLMSFASFVSGKRSSNEGGPDFANVNLLGGIWKWIRMTTNGSIYIHLNHFLKRRYNTYNRAAPTNAITTALA